VIGTDNQPVARTVGEVAVEFSVLGQHGTATDLAGQRGMHGDNQRPRQGEERGVSKRTLEQGMHGILLC